MTCINNCVILGLFLNISDHPCLRRKTALSVKNVDFVAKMMVGIPDLPFSSYGNSSKLFYFCFLLWWDEGDNVWGWTDAQTQDVLADLNLPAGGLPVPIVVHLKLLALFSRRLRVFSWHQEAGFTEQVRPGLVGADAHGATFKLWEWESWINIPAAPPSGGTILRASY